MEANGIKWHKPEKGEVVSYWDENAKRMQVGKVLRPAGASVAVRSG